MKALDRDKLLNMSDSDLLGHSRMDFFISTGKGGQKRNKTSSAVRLTLKDSSICASSSDDRQQSVNKKLALRKLRFAIALELRQEPVAWEGQLDMNPKNPQYPLFIACVLDHILSHDWQVSEASKSLNISTGKLIKILAKDDTLWQHTNTERQKLNLKQLRR
jgi:hypothetical protein